jgi:glycosyltransferase involved in cell wall biosynthesis
MHSLKILIGTHAFFPDNCGGTGVLAHEVARGLRAYGHDVSILAGREEEKISSQTTPWMSEDTYDNFKIYRLHYGSAGISDAITRHLYSPDRIRLIKDLVLQVKPDLVHFYHIMGFSAAIIPELRHLGFPIIFTPTDYWAVCPKTTLLRTFDQKVCDGPGDGVMCVKCFNNMPDFLARWRMKLGQTFLRKFSQRFRWPYMLGRRVKDMADCVNASNQILTETKFLSDILIRHGFDERLIEVVPTGVDIGAIPEPMPLPSVFTATQPLHMGFIGTLSSIKGPQIILEALSLLGKAGEKVVLDIYGKQNPEDPFFQMLQTKAKSLSVGVRFKGTFSHEKMGQTLSSFHLLIIPSIWYESAPLVLCSALAAGTPVVVSRLEGMTEIMEEGIHGYTFPAGGAKALRDLILKILENPEMLRKIYQDPHPRKRSTEEYVRDVEQRYRQILK